jgi:hypothetical protein
MDTTHCHFSGIMQLCGIETQSGMKNSKLKAQGFCDGPSEDTLDELIRPEETPYDVDYFNRHGTRFPDGVTAVVDGSLTIRETQGGPPTLFLRPDSMSPYVLMCE